MKKQTPVGRLNYSGELDPVIDRLCAAYGIGQPDKFSIVEVGYEDCNVVIETAKGKYVAKMFSKTRKPEEVERYTSIMRKVAEAGVNYPELMHTDKREIIHNDREANGISMVLTRFVEGKTFFELDRAPDRHELNLVAEQAAKVNRIDYRPPYLFDSWAIPNIVTMFERVRQFVNPDDIGLVKEVISRFNKIPINVLPHCFVHGDFTKANVIKTADGKVYILDFSVSNWYPRIQELAVIAANLCYDGETALQQRSDAVVQEYVKFSKLTPEERKHLYSYTLAGVAMEFMGSHQERFINGNDTKETEYWFNLGREGLRQALK